MPPRMHSGLFDRLIDADKTRCWHRILTQGQCPHPGIYHKARDQSYGHMVNASTEHRHWIDDAVWCQDHKHNFHIKIKPMGQISEKGSPDADGTDDRDGSPVALHGT